MQRITCSRSCPTPALCVLLLLLSAPMHIAAADCACMHVAAAAVHVAATICVICGHACCRHCCYGSCLTLCLVTYVTIYDVLPVTFLKCQPQWHVTVSMNYIKWTASFITVVARIPLRQSYFDYN